MKGIVNILIELGKYFVKLSSLFVGGWKSEAISRKKRHLVCFKYINCLGRGVFSDY